MTENRFFSFTNSRGDSFEIVLFQAASGDWCITVITYNSENTYNIGTEKEAMESILSFVEEDPEWMDTDYDE